MTGKQKKSIQIDSLKHQDKRVNIPTEELRDFVAEDEAEPETMLYSRDPSLDPQLVWKGKDQQDGVELEVPIVPIYIQEKIHPQAIVENLRAEMRKETPVQADIFADFNGINFEQQIEFYQHEQNWSNRMILGDSLQVMTSLAEKEGLKGKVQMIYIDPPYGIKFGSNWQVSTRKRDVTDGKAEDLTRQPEQIKAFRDTWELGIHSYLSYLRDRLVVARELLTDSGSVFVQIGDENVHLVRCLLDEVFGSENFVNLVSFEKTTSFETKTLASVSDYLIWYAKEKAEVKYHQLFRGKLLGGEKASNYDLIELTNVECRKITIEEMENPSLIPKGAKIFALGDIRSSGWSETGSFAFEFEGKQYKPYVGSHWKTTLDGMGNLKRNRRLIVSGNTLMYKRFLDDFPVSELANHWADVRPSFQQNKIYVVQTIEKVIERCLLMSTDPGDLVLDPTCGSGTTAYVAEQWGRRWITIDTSRVALALARTRLMAAKYLYYHLADSPDGIAKESEITGKIPPPYETHHDIKKGFVYKRVPHITLKSIAHNSEIDEIYSRWQEKMEPVRRKLNELLGKNLEEWELPREPEEGWQSEAKELLSKWWEMRLQRQKEIDDSIARNADSETLYDQPYEDKKRVRVSGPFTVESLSPHRVISPDQEISGTQGAAQKETSDKFIGLIIDNLRKAGVQNMFRNERLKFDFLEPYAGTWLHAKGEYREVEKVKRVAVFIGPEHGTVGPDMVKDAAKEAVLGIGFDTLVVCGFAFDPHVSEEAKRYGKLTVLITRMNSDLTMGDELLKKTGSGNLFMVFGEPDIEMIQLDGRIEIEIKGVDVYDPTTGEIRSSSTDDIACWFIDTNYNGESFFVRHAYFTGADRPYNKLKRALRVEIDEEAWSALYSTKSRPFDRPSTGKIAVKVINHYGDEVLKVFEV